jgi:hypothetical protein
MVGEMYFYKIGYHSYEESAFAELTHENKYTDEEIHNIVSNAVIRVLQEIVAKKKKCIFNSSYEGLHDLITEDLIEMDGFKKVKYQSIWSCFGWASVTNEEDWEGQRGDNLKRLSSEIPIDLKQKINEMEKE